MTYLLAAILTIVNLLWLLLAAAGLPGTWMIALTTLAVAWWRWDAQPPGEAPMFGQGALLVLVGLAVAGELIEFFAGMAGAKKAGASGWGSVGAIAGSLVGGIAATFLIPLPVVGSLLGACLGAAAGAWFFEFGAGRAHQEALRSGVGAGIGRLKGTLAKLLVACVMWLVATTAAWWP